MSVCKIVKKSILILKGIMTIKVKEPTPLLKKTNFNKNKTKLRMENLTQNSSQIIIAN